MKLATIRRSCTCVHVSFLCFHLLVLKPNETKAGIHVGIFKHCISFQLLDADDLKEDGLTTNAKT